MVRKARLCERLRVASFIDKSEEAFKKGTIMQYTNQGVIAIGIQE